MTAREVTHADIESSAARITGHIRRTPVLELGDTLSPSIDLVLKLEHLQVTGSFKARGAFSALTRAVVPPAGVVAASGGNFGIAVAYAAAQLGREATIFVPETSPAEKIERIGAHGARVEVIAGYYDEAKAAAEDFSAETDALRLHAYDQHEIVSGQGTLGMELADQTETEVVIVAVGGGGLISGIASWYREEATVIAVEPHNCRSFNAALEAGGPVEVDVSGVAASSLGARSIGEHTWNARHWIDDSVLVSDEAIVEAQRWLWANARLAVEPAGAAPVAALLEGVFQPQRRTRVTALLSGGNVDPASVG